MEDGYYKDFRQRVDETIVKKLDDSLVGNYSRNLCSGIEVGGINQTTGQNDDSLSTTRRTQYTDIGENTTFTVSGFVGTSTQLRFFYYDKNKTYLRNELLTSLDQKFTITTDSNTKYVRFQGYMDVMPVTNSTIKVELGKEATYYEPYIPTNAELYEMIKALQQSS